MKFDIITIFPHILDSYTNESILVRAIAKKLLALRFHNLRDYTTDKHQKVDDKPYGGGPGMLYKVEPVARAISVVTRKMKKGKVILLSPRGKPFNQQMAKRYAKLDQLVFVCPRYEGIDERVKQYIDEEVSIGPYVLSGGELPAMVIIEAVSRYIPGVLGKEESLIEESHSNKGTLEYPQYTRPEEFKGKKVPQVLLSGNHEKIALWRKKHSKKV